MDLQALQPLLIAVAVANEYLGSRARLCFGTGEAVRKLKESKLLDDCVDHRQSE